MIRRISIFLIFCFAFLTVQSQDLERLGTINLSGANARFVEFTPDGQAMIGATSSDISAWYTSSGSKMFEYSSEVGEITAMTISLDNRFIATGGNKGSVNIFDLEDKSSKTIQAHNSEILGIAVSPDGKYFATSSKDKKVKLFDLESKKLIREIEGHKNYILSLAINQDDLLLYGGSDENTYVWSIAEEKDVVKEKFHQNWIRSVAFSPDGKLFATGSDDGKVYLGKIIDGKVEGQILKGQSGRINGLSFSADGKYLAAGSGNSRLVIWNTENREAVSTHSFINTPVVAVDFDATGKNLATITSPGSSVRLWDTRNLNIKQVVRFKDISDKTPPQIYISNPPNITNDRVRFSKDLIDIKGVIIDDAGVRKLRINNIETPFNENGSFIIKLPLTMGDNFINIEATDINDNIALKKFVISRRNLDGEDYDPTKARNYVVIIGIDDYEHWPKLQNAVRDANDIANILISKYDFNFSDVKMLTNEQATRSNIYNTLRKYIETVTPQDNLLVYFSGHGHFDELLNEGYWIPYEANLKTEGDYLPNSSILKILQNINSQHTFLVADACFSGSLFADQKRGFIDNVESYKSRWGLASGRLETVSDGAYGKNSPFADAFIKFLKENNKDKVAVSELVQYVKMNVAEVSNQTPIGNPLKSLGGEGGEFIFYKKN